MRSRTSLLVLSLCVSAVAAACTSSAVTTAEVPAPPTTMATSTTRPPAPTTSFGLPTTTSSAPVVEVTVTGDLPDGLRDAASAFYTWLADHRAPRPAIPNGLWYHLFSVVRTSAALEAAGVVRELANDDSVAVVHVGDDVLLAVKDPNTWRIVGADLADAPAWYGGFPRKLLVLGSDARAGENQRRLRADSIHMVAVVPEVGGAIVGFPRDSWVQGPDGGTKFTNLMAGRGPEIMLETTKELTGVALEGYIVTGFKGFQGLIKDFGGLVITLPSAIRSGIEGWRNYRAGTLTLNAEDTLRLARIRKTLPGGDFSRSLNHGRIMLAAMVMVQDMGIDALPQLTDMLLEHTWTDLSTEELFTFGATVFTVDSDAFVNDVLPGSVGRAAGQSVVFLASSADEVYRDFDDGILENG